MPSRLGVGFILLFWAVTTAVVGYREVWPWLASDGPPPLRIDLADEAAAARPAGWGVYRGNQRIGSLVTRMEYVADDDTFRFVNTYQGLSFDFAPVALRIPRLQTVVRVTRSGELREQHMTGTLSGSFKMPLGTLPIGEAAAEVTGVVENGQLVGRCKIWYPASSATPTIDRALEPVPVPAGQVLNPMMPVGRLRDVQPGRRWVIREVDPLRDAVNILLREAAKDSQVAMSALPRPENRELLAEVRSKPEKLVRADGQSVECWVIEYRGDEVVARTWVSVADGRVLRQEAAGFGEQLRFERED
jgi:hypothetical protein